MALSQLACAHARAVEEGEEEKYEEKHNCIYTVYMYITFKETYIHYITVHYITYKH